MLPQPGLVACEKEESRQRLDSRELRFTQESVTRDERAHSHPAMGLKAFRVRGTTRSQSTETNRTL